MENVLHIVWETGYMNINLDSFFPCTKNKFKRLLKIIQLDWHSYELRETLKVYFQERIKRLPLEAEESRKEAAKHRKEAEGFQEEIKKDKAKRKRLGLAPDEFHLYTPYENAVGMAQEAEKKARQLDRAKPLFEWYLECLRSK